MTVKRKHEGRGWKMEDGTKARRRGAFIHLPSSIRHPRLLLAAGAALLTCAATAWGQPTQEEFFKSLQQNVDSSGGGDAKVVLAFLGGATVLVLLAVLYGNRQKRRAVKPKALNNGRKLVREVAKAAGVKGWELKELKTAADDGACASPLTLLICPSLIAKAVTDPLPGAKANRRALAQIARRWAVR